MVRASHRGRTPKITLATAYLCDLLMMWHKSRQLVVKPNTLKKYNALIRVLAKWDKYKLSQVDLQFYEDFLHQIAHFKHNTKCNYIRALKEFLSWCADRGHGDVDVSFIKRPKYKKIHVVLPTVSQIELMERATGLPPYLDTIRDLWLLMYYTGQRYSDLKAFKAEAYNEGLIMIQQQKTDTFVYVPMSAKALGIMEKYQWKLPVYTNQVINRGLKDVCRRIGLRVWVTCHTARRCFITHRLNDNVNPSLLMMVTGHTRIETLMSYSHPTLEDLKRVLG